MCRCMLLIAPDDRTEQHYGGGKTPREIEQQNIYLCTASVWLKYRCVVFCCLRRAYNSVCIFLMASLTMATTTEFGTYNLIYGILASIENCIEYTLYSGNDRLITNGRITQSNNIHK